MFESSLVLLVVTVIVGCGGRGGPPDSNFEVSFVDRLFLVPPHRNDGLAVEEPSLPDSSGVWTTELGVSSSSFFLSFCSELVTKSVDALWFVWMTSSFWSGSDLGVPLGGVVCGAGSDFPGATLESRVSSSRGLALLSLVAFGLSLAGLLKELGLESEAAVC